MSYLPTSNQFSQGTALISKYYGNLAATAPKLERTGAGSRESNWHGRGKAKEAVEGC